MTSECFNKCLERINKKEPLMNWAMVNFNLLDYWIKQDMNVNSLKEICNEVLHALELADLDASCLMEFLDTRGYGVTIEMTNDNITFSKTR